MPKKKKGIFNNKKFRAFFYRTVIFLTLFLSEILLMTLFLDFTGLDFGHAFISTHAHLSVYIFILLFIILSHKDLWEIKKVKKIDYKRAVPFILLNLLVLWGFYKLSIFFTENALIVAQNPLSYTTLWWLLGISVPITLLLALFSIRYITYFIKEFRNQIFLSAALATIFVGVLNYSVKLWPLFSKIVARSVYFLLSIFFEGARYTMDGSIPTVGIPAVAAKIFAPCSGIEGMSLFLLLFTVLVMMEYKSLNFTKVLILYVLGTLGAFAVNILRTFSIFVIGHFTSAEFAIGAFHSNVGWVFFTLYFLIFIYLAYPWMKK